MIQRCKVNGPLFKNHGYLHGRKTNLCSIQVDDLDYGISIDWIYSRIFGKNENTKPRRAEEEFSCKIWKRQHMAKDL